MSKDVVFSLADLLASPTSTTFSLAPTTHDDRSSIGSSAATAYIPIKLDLDLGGAANSETLASLTNSPSINSSISSINNGGVAYRSPQTSCREDSRSSVISSHIKRAASSYRFRAHSSSSSDSSGRNNNFYFNHSNSPASPPESPLSYTSSVYSDYNGTEYSYTDWPSAGNKVLSTAAAAAAQTQTPPSPAIPVPPIRSSKKHNYQRKSVHKLKDAFKGLSYNPLDKALPVISGSKLIPVVSQTPATSAPGLPMPKSIVGRQCCVCEELMEYLMDNEKPVVLKCSHVCHYMCLLQLLDMEQYDCNHPENNASNGLFSDCPNCCQPLSPLDDNITKMLINDAMLDYHDRQRQKSLRMLNQSPMDTSKTYTGNVKMNRTDISYVDGSTADPQTPKAQIYLPYRDHSPRSTKSDGSASTLYSTPTRYGGACSTLVKNKSSYHPMEPPLAINTHMGLPSSLPHQVLTNEQLAALPLSQRRMYRTTVE